MTKSDTKSTLRGAGGLLKEERHEVPKHQRPFAWTEYQVQELLEDIGGAFAEGADEYFLGSIVAIPSKNEQWHEVLDGQQRLATLSLLFASIENAFKKQNDAPRANEVHSYLGSFDMASGSYKPRLRLSDQDNAYFEVLVSDKYSPPSVNSPESHSRLYKARTMAELWLVNQLEGVENTIRWLTNLTKFLDAGVYVIYFTVSDDANAYLIFETLNDRGLELSIADLLKNYLLGRSGPDTSYILEVWKRTLSILSANRQEHLFTVFLRHMWSSKYAVVREKDLYKTIKNTIKTEAAVKSFAELLEHESYLYSAILSPEHEYWTSKRSRSLMRTLDELGLEQYRPLLLAALGTFENKRQEVESLLGKLIAWNVRLLISGGGGGGVMERNYSELARELRAGKLETVAAIAKLAKKFVPPDTAFREAFAVARVSNAGLARYYLRALEKAEGGEEQPEYIPNDDPSELNLEHILPEKPEGNWPQFSEDERREYTKRIGNMLLLPQKLNSKLKSQSFDQKVKYYKAAKLLLTKNISKQKEWTPSVIAKTQDYLATLAVRTWPL